MCLQFSKVLMILLVCLTFLGQAMASTVMTYNMISMKATGMQAQVENMTTMPHCNNMKRGSNSTQSIKDCCSYGCNCLTVGTASFLLPVNPSFNSIITIYLPLKITSTDQVLPTLIHTSPYKPPIIS